MKAIQFLLRSYIQVYFCKVDYFKVKVTRLKLQRDVKGLDPRNAHMKYQVHVKYKKPYLYWLRSYG